MVRADCAGSCAPRMLFTSLVVIQTPGRLLWRQLVSPQRVPAANQTIQQQIAKHHQPWPPRLCGAEGGRQDRLRGHTHPRHRRHKCVAEPHVMYMNPDCGAVSPHAAAAPLHAVSCLVHALEHRTHSARCPLLPHANLNSWRRAHHRCEQGLVVMLVVMQARHRNVGTARQKLPVTASARGRATSVLRLAAQTPARHTPLPPFISHLLA